MSSPALTENEFLEIEEALASTPRGRLFLRMRDQRQRVVAIEEVRRLSVSIRDWVTRKVDTGGASHITILRRELHEMGAYIQRTREELASLRMKDGAPVSGSSRFNLATEELDEIVRSTERATSDILNAAEHVLKLADSVQPVAAKAASSLVEHATEILTACSFQDLTGQRITKVVNTLRYLEQRVNAMIEIWGVESSAKPVDEPVDARPDAHLLNGPARRGEERSQADIDAILNGVTGGGDAKLPELLNGAKPAEAPNGAKPTEPASGVKPADSLNGAKPAAAATQSDIDRLFS